MPAKAGVGGSVGLNWLRMVSRHKLYTALSEFFNVSSETADAATELVITTTSTSKSLYVKSNVVFKLG